MVAYDSGLITEASKNCTASLRQPSSISKNERHEEKTAVNASLNRGQPSFYHSTPYIVSASCLLPQYHIYTWVLAMMCLASFLKLNYLIKSTILVVMVSVYATLMLVAYPQIFSEIQVKGLLKLT